MHGTPPPASVWPLMKDKNLVEPTMKAMGFPKGIPGIPDSIFKAENFVFPVMDYDWGPQYDHSEANGVPTNAPPPILNVIKMLVPRVDQDGNEIGGIPTVLNDAPLGTYLGWNITSGPSDAQYDGRPFHAGQVCNYVGGMVPFAKTKAQRVASNDPRPSLEERYGTRENWLEGVRAAANEMVAQRYLLKADADAMIAQAEASNILKALPAVPTQTVVEYYWAGKDQYFYTSNGAEIASLDTSASWKRTGQSFKAFVSGSSQGQGTAVCRNYGTSGAATDAHLFSVSAAECTSYTNAPLSNNWVRESASAFEVALPYSVTGACPKNTVPVYRVDNHRGDTNARYTTDLATREAMLGKGAVKGGFGPTGVGMCAPV
jgi:hypothetical protein